VAGHSRAGYIDRNSVSDGSIFAPSRDSSCSRSAASFDASCRRLCQPASDDKESVAKPLADTLGRYGYVVWLDKCVLRLGDSPRRTIDDALGTCRYGVVILSPSFFRKEWPQRELDGLVSMEILDRRKRILPVWHKVAAVDVARYSPSLANRLGVSTDLGIDVVVSEIVDALKRDLVRPTTPDRP
jgi:hypothetical protein